MSMHKSVITEKPTLSFCIPTYNRFKKVISLVNELLKYNGNDIEVVVIDNHSTDNTASILSGINDDRFFFYENELNIGPLHNALKGMTKCNGDFIFMCLDKDFIIYQHISKLVSFFKKNMDIAVGYCSLYEFGNNEIIIYKKGIEALNGVAYLSKHPTGNFFNNKLLSSLNIMERFSDENKVGGFALDFIAAELCLLGNAANINTPLCTLETQDEAKNYKSLTYSGTDGNAYFFPAKRFDTFNNYVTHIRSLSTSEINKRIMIKKTFHRELIRATIEFRNKCQDVYVCAHYNLTPRKIGILQLFKYDMEFCNKFINKCSYRSRSFRILICAQVHFKIAVNVCRMLIEKVRKKVFISAK